MNPKILNNGVAIQLDGIDITSLTNDDIALIKEYLYKNLIVVLKHQNAESFYYTKFVEGIGKVASYDQMIYAIDGEVTKYPAVHTNEWKHDIKDYPVQRVTGKKTSKNEISGIFGTGILDWHANLNGLDRADGVALQGIEDCENTSTSFLNTNMAYLELPSDLKKDIENVYAEYEYSPEIWAKGLPESHYQKMIKKRNKYKMWLIQENVKGIKGIYFYTNNKCKIITDDNTLYNRLYDHVFQEKYIYQHWYEPGDIISVSYTHLTLPTILRV